MDALPTLESLLTPTEREVWEGLTSPAKIQAFLDQTRYEAVGNRSVLNVLRTGQAHCLDGALFGAAALRRLGDPPLIVDLLPEPGTDDDHVLALFKRHGCWGAVAKSNFVGLRYREPVYRTLRELIMSYFEPFYNVEGQKTLRAYSRPVHLARWDKVGWLWDDAGVDALEHYLYTLKRIPLISEAMAQALEPVDKASYDAGLSIVNPAGLYRPQH
jgi:hypothetical protein